MLVDILRAVPVIPLNLRRLDGDGSILAVAGVDLDRLLIGSDLETDAGGFGVHAHRWDHRFLGRVRRGPVDNEAIVVADAVGTAEPVSVFDVGADELSRGEIGAAVVGGRDLRNRAVGDKVAVCGDVALGQRKLEPHAVEDVVVLEPVQVPVDMVRHHDGRGLGHGQRDQPRGQLRQALGVLGGAGGVDAEDCMGDDVAWEALLGPVDQGESDGRLRVGGDGPIALVVADVSSVEGIGAVVFVFRNVVCVSVDGERAILDPVRVASDHRPEECMVGFGIMQVLFGIVVADHHILHVTVSVRDQEGSQSRAIGDQFGGDVVRFDGVWFEVVRVMMVRRVGPGQDR